MGGLVLGTVNYFSVYALLRALNSDGLPASFFFPVNNLGVVLLALLLSGLLFKEKPDPKQKAGIGVSLIAILLLSL
jgi:drug/metabolite transporter (DMT)-like permease